LKRKDKRLVFRLLRGLELAFFDGTWVSDGHVAVRASKIRVLPKAMEIFIRSATPIYFRYGTVILDKKKIADKMEYLLDTLKDTEWTEATLTQWAHITCDGITARMITYTGGKTFIDERYLPVLQLGTIKVSLETAPAGEITVWSSDDVLLAIAMPIKVEADLPLISDGSKP